MPNLPIDLIHYHLLPSSKRNILLNNFTLGIGDRPTSADSDNFLGSP